MGGEEPQQKEGRVREVGQDWRRWGLCRVPIKQGPAGPPHKVCSSRHGATSELPASSPPLPPLPPHLRPRSGGLASDPGPDADAVEARRRGRRLRGAGRAVAGEPGRGGGGGRAPAAAAGAALVAQVAPEGPALPGEAALQLRAPPVPLLSGAAPLRPRPWDPRPPHGRFSGGVPPHRGGSVAGADPGRASPPAVQPAEAGPAAAPPRRRQARPPHQVRSAVPRGHGGPAAGPALPRAEAAGGAGAQRPPLRGRLESHAVLQDGRRRRGPGPGPGPGLSPGRGKGRLPGPRRAADPDAVHGRPLLSRKNPPAKYALLCQNLLLIYQRIWNICLSMLL